VHDRTRTHDRTCADALVIVGEDTKVAPIHWASRYGKISMLDLLVKNGANVNAVDINSTHTHTHTRTRTRTSTHTHTHAHARTMCLM
jgi:hypothetical protein